MRRTTGRNDGTTERRTITAKRAFLGGALPVILALLAVTLPASGQSKPEAVDRFVTFPFPTELVSAPGGQRIAWVLEDKGVRNVWGAEGPAWAPKQLTTFTAMTARP